MGLFSKLSYGIERFDDCLAEINELGKDHYEEVVTHSPGEYALDEELYHHIENSGNLRLFTARDNDKSLRGYCAFMIQYDSHARHVLVATEDSIYIQPTYRGNGRQFIDFQDEVLGAEGVERIYRHVPLQSRHGRMLQSYGYQPIQQLYVKKIPFPKEF